MTALTNSNSNEKDKDNEKMILKSSELCSKNEFPCDNEEASYSFSGTRELLKRAREAANQKFAKSITVTTTLNSTAQSSKLVLKGSESPAWNGQIIKTKLIRPAKPLETCQKKEAKNRVSLSTSKMSPASSSLFDYFKTVRKEYEDFREIEAVRLQKRLEKLSDFEPINEQKQKFEEFEKEIVPWQNDSSTNSCYLCFTDFTVINRRHHCRLCGRIVCADCIDNIPIKLKNFEVKDLKSCKKCYKFLFKKKIIYEGNLSISEKKMYNLFKKIKSLKEQLLETIPKFNEYLLEETITEARPLKQWKQDAWALRDTLILYSVHFRSIVQELAEVCEDEALEKPIFKILSSNLRRAGNEFLQKHMFTLQILDLDTRKEAEEQFIISTDSSKSSNSGGGGFKMFFNELFNVKNNIGTGELSSMEFYTDDGEILKDPETLKYAINNQQSVLKEQLIQLEKAKFTSLDDENIIKMAINDIKLELKRINNKQI